MYYIETEINGVWLIEPRVFCDARGYFMETFREEEFRKQVGDIHFVQDNESRSSYGVLRGLHYQKGEYSQAKLVRVIKGRVWDVAVDLRRSSPTFGQHISVELSEDTIFTYKVDNVYCPQAEASIRFDDKDLGVSWPMPEDSLILSEKDKRAVSFREAEYFE